MFLFPILQDDSVGEIFLEYNGLWPTAITK